jgi:5-formyltetrahydrofolate cyclo-ligase
LTNSDRPVEDKARLRRRMKALREALPAAERDRRAGLIEDRLLVLSDMARAATVLLFYSFGSEVATRGIAARLRREGRRVLFPYLEGGDIEAAEAGPEGEALIPTTYGPREPSRRRPVDPRQIDVVVTPGLAFDRRGARLGYGGGHYDRYLSGLDERTVRVGIAFREQVIDRVPERASDQRVHLVVTDLEVIDCRSG